MKLLKLSLKGFGKFIDREINLAEGLNIIYGRNEAGKSTIHSFIEGVFFSFKKPDSSRRIWTPELEKYRPWQSEGYSGFIVYQHQGQNYRLERYFSKERDQVRLFDELTGEELTNNFNEKPNQEREILEEQLGLTPAIFKNTISISQLAVKSSEHLLNEAKNRLVNLSETGSEEIYINQAYQLIKEAVNRIGTERQTTKEHYKLIKQIDELQTELKLSREIYQSLQEEETRLSLLKQEQDKLNGFIEEKQLFLQQLTLSRDYSYQQNVAAVKQELAAVAEELNAAQHLKDFPAHSRDELLSLQEKMQGLKDIKLELEQEQTEKKSILVERRLNIEENKVLEGLSYDDLERLKLAYNSFEDRQQTYLQLKTQEEKINDELVEKKQLIEEQFTAYADLTMSKLSDYEKLEDEFKNTGKLQQLEYNIDRKQRKLSVLQDRLAGIKKVLAVSGFFGLVVATAGWIYPLFLTGLLPILLVVIHSVRKSGKIQKEIKTLIQQRREFLQQLEQYKAKLTKDKYDLRQIYAGYGVGSLAELRTGLIEYINLQKEKMMLENQRSQLRKQIAEQQKQQSEKEKVIRSYLTLVGEEELTQHNVTGLLERLKLYLQQERELNPRKEELGRLERKLEENNDKYQRLQLRKKKLLEQAGVEDIAEFEEKYQQYLKIKERKELFLHKQRELAAMQEGREEKGVEEPKQLELSGELPEFDQEVYLQTEQELNELKDRSIQLLREADILAAEIDTRLSQVKNPAELEENLLQAEKKRQDNEVNLQALQIADDYIKQVSQQMHREYAPRLNALVGDIISEITASRYEKVRISSAFDIKVQTEDGSSRDLGHFSSGTIDQFYFAFRLAAAALLTGNDRLPLFLDESFVQFDRSRLRNVLTYLGRLSAERQILLFTCHQRERALVEELGLEANVINLD